MIFQHWNCYLPLLTSGQNSDVTVKFSEPDFRILEADDFQNLICSVVSGKIFIKIRSVFA